MLSSELAGPRSPYFRTTASKAGSLLFRLIQNHPYVDGNKRLALTAALAFLYINGLIVLAGADELEALAVGVAAGAFSQADAMAFFRARSFRLAWSPEAGLRWFRALRIGDRVAVAAAAPKAGKQHAALRDLAVVLGVISEDDTT